MKTFHILLISLVAVIATGCTHNNGDIGPFFGQWIMTDITADGVPPTDVVPTDWNWRFQNSTILISHVNHLSHDSWQYWASWSRNGQSLNVNFDNTDNVEGWVYETPAEIGFTQHATYTIFIEHETSGSMTLRMVNTEGLTYVYTLKKI